MALLVAADDFGTAGETFRLRQSSTTVGREGTDIQIAHDALMSRHHATIDRKQTTTGYTWSIKDSKSQNGTFARVQRITLRDDKEFILGATRYAFRTPSPGRGVAQESEGSEQVATTMQWNTVSEESMKSAAPLLIELAPDGSEKRSIRLEQGRMVLGRDPSSDFRMNDEYADARHARLSIDHDRGIVLEDLNSMNGLWVRIERLRLTENCDLLMGEQKFRFVITESKQ